MSLKVLGHCHLFPAGLNERPDELGVPGTSEHLFRFLDACGFDRAQVISPFDPPSYEKARSRAPVGQAGLDWLLARPHVGTEGTSRLIPTASIAPDRPEAVERLRHAMRLGVRLIKIHPLVNRSDTLAPACDPFYELAERAAMPITYHTGPGGWDWPGDHTHPSACARIAGRFPGLPILMAHCGAFGHPEGFEEALEMCEQHDNLYLDATGALGPVGRERWKAALDRVGPERVIYGNDYPWCSTDSVREDQDFVDSLGLDIAGRERILGGTFMELYEAAQPLTDV